ncbi:3-keto-5-aminohexanoate cleavage protein [Leisingera sp.]|uniref:3-keto-5-aminohexanoate cleavage protein n=1 Tax=Leisingera sp. TaxID=1879318 RepID=UPI003A955240
MTTSIDNPLVICAAITGGGPAKKRTPFHPVSHDALVEEAIACGRAGAAIVHLHARDKSGQPTMSVSAYRDLVHDIRAAGSDVVINFSAGDNGGRSNHAERRAVIGAGAEMVSFGAGSFNIHDRLYDNSPNYVNSMLEALRQQRVLPEIEIFDTGQLQNVKRLLEEGAIPTPASLQFVFGISGGMPASKSLLNELLKELPAKCHWSICCQTPDHSVWREMMLYAFLRGGDIRTGMEDVVQTTPGVLASSNAELVHQWVETANIWGRPLVKPADLRRQLGLPALRHLENVS